MFVCYSWHVLYLGCPLLGGFTLIPRNISTPHAKNITLNMTIFASLKKLHTKIIFSKRKLNLTPWFKWSGISLLLKKPCWPARGHLSAFTSQKTTDETENFLKHFAPWSRLNLVHICGISQPIFKQKNEETCCNDRHRLQWGSSSTRK